MTSTVASSTALVFRVNSPGPATSPFTLRLAARVTESSVITVSLGRVPSLGFAPAGQSLLSEIPSVGSAAAAAASAAAEEEEEEEERAAAAAAEEGSVVIAEHVLENLLTLNQSEEADNPMPRTVANLVMHVVDMHVDQVQDIVTKLEMDLDAIEIELGKGASSSSGCQEKISKLEMILDSEVYTVEDRSELEKYSPSATLVDRYYDAYKFNNEKLNTTLHSSFEKIDDALVSLQKSPSNKFKDTNDILEASKKSLSSYHAKILHCIDNLGLICATEREFIERLSNPEGAEIYSRVVPSWEVVEMSVVQLSYTMLLGEISGKLGVETPDCIVTIAAEGWFIAYVDLTIVRGGSVIEVARNWGSPSTDSMIAWEDAARVAIQRMKKELGLQIKDANYDDFILYKNLYDAVALQNSDFIGQLTSLRCEHNLLKDSYATVVSEKAGVINEQIRLRHGLNDCHATINLLRSAQSSMACDPADVGSAT
ncbi:uncharacterized protein LOC109705653 isoform X2 [Ananas comosus]|uniref:Uncharacterized protein LOC109705653 isoform X2 n=1 Tax=Ananas comosus TaxID=4615 RepID=A0A6P5EF23_ANACO|nr:uncharacterized protein LOC109705653 isoform X2 [Ananas comosus]